MLYRLSYPSFMPNTVIGPWVYDSPHTTLTRGRKKKLDQRGIDPRTSRMLSERSTT